MSKYGELIGECILKPIRPPAKRAWWELFASRRPLFVLVTGFTFIDPSGRKWDCRKGGRADGNSIPWWLLWLIPTVTGRSVEAFVVHDIACKNRRSVWRPAVREVVARLDVCTDLWTEILRTVMGYCMRNPKTTAEIRANQGGEGRAKRNRAHLPTSWDDIWIIRQRTWKARRRTQ